MRCLDAFGILEAIDDYERSHWQRWVGLEPDPNSGIRFPLAHFEDDASFGLRSDSAREQWEKWGSKPTKDKIFTLAAVTMERGLGPHAKDMNHHKINFLAKLERTTELEKSVLITQSPTLSAKFDPFCCTGWVRTTPSITSNSGITLGKITETLSRIQEEHLLCPRATLGEHDAEGYVYPEHMAIHCDLKVNNWNPPSKIKAGEEANRWSHVLQQPSVLEYKRAKGYGK